MILSGLETELPTADICIVGAGPVGLAMALKLESLGMRVLLLEAGPQEGDTEHAVGPVEFLNDHHATSFASNRRGLGGSSSRWGGRCVTYDDLDIQPRAHVPYSGWPISHDAFSRFYPEALEFLQFQPDRIDLPNLVADDPEVGAESIERWSKNPYLGDLHRQHLRHSQRIIVLTSATVSNILLTADGKTDCLEISCQGKLIEIRAGAFVLAGGGLENARLLLGLQARSPGRFGSGALGRFYQGHLTGYIAVVEFSQAEFAEALSFQRTAKGYVFRRRLQISPEVQIREKLLNTVFWIDPISIADPVHGSGALSLLYLLSFVSGLYGLLANGLAPRSRSQSSLDRRKHFENFLSDRRSAPDLVRLLTRSIHCRAERQRMLTNPRGRYLLRYHAEQMPDPDSRVTMNGPSRALSVDYRVRKEDLDSVLNSHSMLDVWLRRNRLGKLEYLHSESERRQAVLNQAFDGYHQIGLTRMSENPDEGVLDADCRVHGILNLYVAGSCVFPTGGHANPTLPAVALALRLAEHLGKIQKTKSA
ncbi:MAG: GMC oxidoreductase [Shinella sp.]|nr:GMC oxidoreductase [Shinella sp.]